MHIKVSPIKLPQGKTQKQLSITDLQKFPLGGFRGPQNKTNEKNNNARLNPHIYKQPVCTTANNTRFRTKRRSD